MSVISFSILGYNRGYKSVQLGKKMKKASLSKERK